MTSGDPNKFSLNKLDIRIQQLEERKRAILRRTSEQDRKARTRRLIETGALVEKYFECEHLSIKEREELFSTFATYINANKLEKFKINTRKSDGEIKNN